MKQIVDNMDLILKKVTKELWNNAAHEVGTLTHTYGNLIKQVPYTDFSDEELLTNIETIKTHQSIFQKIINEVHNLIAKSLNINEYKKADKWSLVLERINRNIGDLEQLIYSLGSLINKKNK